MALEMLLTTSCLGLNSIAALRGDDKVVSRNMIACVVRLTQVPYSSKRRPMMNDPGSDATKSGTRALIGALPDA